MNEYCRPEVTVLGDAANVIQGSKPGLHDGSDPLVNIKQDECTED